MLAILVLLGGVIFIRILLAIFRNASNKVRAIVGLIFAIIMALIAMSVLKKIQNNQLESDDAIFSLLIVPLLIGIGIGFIFVTINYEEGGNWYEYFSIGNFSFGQDISIGIIIPLIAVIVVATIINILLLGFLGYIAFIIYGIVHLYFFIRVFISPND